MESQKQNMSNFFSSLELKLISYGCFLGFGGLSHVFPSYFMMTSSMIYGDQISEFRDEGVMFVPPHRSCEVLGFWLSCIVILRCPTGWQAYLLYPWNSGLLLLLLCHGVVQHPCWDALHHMVI